ncbi:hypothetical protein [Kiloniella majae]|uniref:hypothetical protein n=1 Tax=Kiloniella majae TaxID=1938558 RepID=UPI000A27937E|nr:hypothetical protein [Kiloniella majae]
MPVGFYLFILFSKHDVRILYDNLKKNQAINHKALNRFSICFLSALLILIAIETPLIYFLISKSYEEFHYSYPILIFLFIIIGFYVVYKNYFKILTNEFLSYNQGQVSKGVIVNKIYHHYGMCSVAYEFTVENRTYKGQSNIGSWFSSSQWKEKAVVDIVYWSKDPNFSTLYHSKELKHYSLSYTS